MHAPCNEIMVSGLHRIPEVGSGRINVYVGRQDLQFLPGDLGEGIAVDLDAEGQSLVFDASGTTSTLTFASPVDRLPTLSSGIRFRLAGSTASDGEYIVAEGRDSEAALTQS